MFSDWPGQGWPATGQLIGALPRRRPAFMFYMAALRIPVAGCRCQLLVAVAGCRLPLPVAGCRCQLLVAVAGCWLPVATAGCGVIAVAVTVANIC